MTSLLVSHSFFFYTIPRPPTCTLFPYTTLFRSGLQAGQCLWGLSGSRFSVAGVRDTQLNCGSLGVDRKSTRLNSSHLVISYAVFCLKKKNKYINLELPTISCMLTRQKSLLAGES